MNTTAYISKEAIVNIAKTCHQANKAWCEANGDNSQKDWDEAEDWQRDSAIKGAEFLNLLTHQHRILPNTMHGWPIK